MLHTSHWRRRHNSVSRYIVSHRHAISGHSPTVHVSTHRHDSNAFARKQLLPVVPSITSWPCATRQQHEHPKFHATRATAVGERDTRGTQSSLVSSWHVLGGIGCAVADMPRHRIPHGTVLAVAVARLQRTVSAHRVQWAATRLEGPWECPGPLVPQKCLLRVRGVALPAAGRVVHVRLARVKRGRCTGKVVRA